MDLHQIRCFLMVAETLNFTRAAERLGITQPSLSRSVARLEAAVGGPLIRRERGRTGLTPLGASILPRLRQMAALAGETEEIALRMSEDEETAFRLGVMCTVGPRPLIGLIDAAAMRVPDIRLDLRDHGGDAIVAALLRGEIDLAVACLPGYPPEVEAIPLHRERYVVGMPAGHRLARLNAVPLRELDGETYLERRHCEYPQHLDSVGVEFPDVRDRISSEREDWIQAMIGAGHGCAVLPEFAEIGRGVTVRPLTAPDISRTVSLLSVRGRPRRAAVEAFHRIARSAVRLRLAGETDAPQGKPSTDASDGLLRVA